MKAPALYWRMRAAADEKSGAHGLGRHRPLGSSQEPPRRILTTRRTTFHTIQVQKPTGVTGATASADGATDSPPEQHPEVAEAHQRNAAKPDGNIEQAAERRRKRTNGERGATIREARRCASSETV